MGTAVLRPNVDISTSGTFTLVGGATVFSITDDAPVDDATYVLFQDQDAGVWVGFTTFALPTNAQVRSVTMRYRRRSDIGADCRLVGTVYDSHTGSLALLTHIEESFIGTTVSEISSAPYVGSLTQAQIDGLSVIINSGLPGDFRFTELYLDLLYNEAPVVVVATPSVVTSKPAITWTYSDPESNTQERARVKVFSAAQYGAGGFDPETSSATYDSGELLSSSNSHTITTALTNGTTYKAYVKASDAGSNGRYGAWDDSAAWTVTADLPANPTITTTGEPTAALGPRVKIDIQGRTNMLTENQSSLETNTTGWTAAGNVTISRVTTFAAHGVASLRLRSLAAGGFAASTTTGAGGIPVVAGQTYTATAEVRRESATADRTVHMQIAWYSSGGSLLSTSVGGALSTGAAFVQRTLTAVAPVNAVFAAVQVLVNGATAANEDYLVDKIGLVPTNYTTWSEGGLVASERFTVEHSSDAGVTWTEITGSPIDPADTTQLATVYDYEAPRGVANRWRVQATSTDAGGNGVSSAVVTSAPDITLAVDANWWLKVLSNPSLNFVPDLKGPTWRWESSEESAAFKPIGKSRHVVVSDVIRGLESSITLMCDTKADFDAFTAARAAQAVMLLQDPIGRQWYIRFTQSAPVEELFVSDPPYREVTIGIVEVDAP